MAEIIEGGRGEEFTVLSYTTWIAVVVEIKITPLSFAKAQRGWESVSIEFE